MPVMILLFAGKHCRGSGFPEHWIWAQASNEQTRIVVAGGDLSFKNKPKWIPDSFLLAWRGRNSTLTWTPLLSVTNPLRVVSNRPCDGEVVLEGTLNGLDIEVHFQAPKVSPNYLFF